MAETTSLSFRTSKENAKQLAQLAAAMDRPKSWLLQQALDAYLDLQAWHIAQIEQGRRDLREGKGLPHEEVVRWMQSWETDGSEPPEFSVIRGARGWAWRRSGGEPDRNEVRGMPSATTE